jgi:hypothetical protein
MVPLDRPLRKVDEATAPQGKLAGFVSPHRRGFLAGKNLPSQAGLSIHEPTEGLGTVTGTKSLAGAARRTVHRCGNEGGRRKLRTEATAAARALGVQIEPSNFRQCRLDGRRNGQISPFSSADIGVNRKLCCFCRCFRTLLTE